MANLDLGVVGDRLMLVVETSTRPQHRSAAQRFAKIEHLKAVVAERTGEDDV